MPHAVLECSSMSCHPCTSDASRTQKPQQTSAPLPLGFDSRNRPSRTRGGLNYVVGHSGYSISSLRRETCLQGKCCPVKPSQTVYALIGRRYSQRHRPAPQLTKLLQGIAYEQGQKFTNAKGIVDFHSFLVEPLSLFRSILQPSHLRHTLCMLQNEELQAVKTTVLEQQAKALVPFQLDAVNYGDWEPDQREAYLRRLYHVLETLRR